MKPGRSLEHLVEVLEKALSTDPAITIQSPCRLRDKVTGQLREHDVVIKSVHGHHHVSIAIECRDRSRLVTVEQIEAFHQKCLHTGINIGVIVSTKGFCSTAREKANHYDIRCLTLAEAKSLSWLATDHISLTHRTLKHIHLHIFPLAPHNLPDNMTHYEMIDAATGIVPYQAITPIVNKALDHIKHVSGKLPPSPVRLKFMPTGLSVRNKHTGETIPIANIYADITYEIETGIAPIKTYLYGEAGNNMPSLEAAIADLDWGPLHGKLVISRAHGNIGSITFVPRKQ